MIYPTLDVTYLNCVFVAPAVQYPLQMRELIMRLRIFTQIMQWFYLFSILMKKSGEGLVHSFQVLNWWLVSWAKGHYTGSAKTWISCSLQEKLDTQYMTPCSWYTVYDVFQRWTSNHNLLLLVFTVHMHDLVLWNVQATPVQRYQENSYFSFYFGQILISHVTLIKHEPI